jgi:hypothetical protein
MQNDLITETIQSAIRDIEERLVRIGPPQFACSDSLQREPSRLFFDGMPHFDSSIFPENIQQYIVALSSSPSVRIGKSTKPKELRLFIFFHQFETAHHVNLSRACEFISRMGLGVWFTRPDRGSKIFRHQRDAEIAYNSILNRSGINRFRVPEKFTSFQLYTFFNSHGLKEAYLESANSLMKRIMGELDSLDLEHRNKCNVEKIVCRLTGLAPGGKCVDALIENWALLQRVGIFPNESDRLLVDVFMEMVNEYASFDQETVYNAVNKACIERKIPGIKNPGSVPTVMKIILGSFFYEVLDNAGVVSEAAARRGLIPVTPVRPDRVIPVNTRPAEVRSLIKEVTLGTGERDSSSLRHGILYNGPARRNKRSDDPA